jgi:D-amino-acid dehydrogenase
MIGFCLMSFFMKVIVAGAGVIGICSAWFLARQGFEVTVIDRQSEAGQETSFANGGQISVSFCEPWASKSAPLKMLQWMMHADSPLLYRFKLDPQQWWWGLKFLGQCNDTAFAQNVRQLVNLGRYSQTALHEILSVAPIAYERQTRGILHYFANAQSFAVGQRNADLMGEFGVQRRALSREEILTIEPAAASFIDKIAGGIYTASDESGDACAFTQGLAAHCAALGVRFLYGHTITQLHTAGDALAGMSVRENSSGSHKLLKADHCVVAAGCYSKGLLAPLGVNLAIYPAKGYSATLKLKQPQLANTASLLDDDRKLAITRLGDFIRVAGTAELTGYDASLDSPTSQTRCAALTKRYEELFPGVADISTPRYWTGLRPSTPNNVPYIGRTKWRGLWVNAGHGTLGWTHAAGSGRAIALLVSGKIPELDMAGWRSTAV